MTGAGIWMMMGCGDWMGEECILEKKKLIALSSTVIIAMPTPANHLTRVDSTLAIFVSRVDISVCVASAGITVSKRASREIRRVSF